MSDDLAICPSCGGHFYPVRGNHRSKYCSIPCKNRANCYKHRHGTLEGFQVKVLGGSARWLELNDPRRRRAERLARRDAEYAAHAAPVTVEQRQFRDSELGMVMRRIETRGNRFCGSFSGAHRQIVTDYGVVYVA